MEKMAAERERSRREIEKNNNVHHAEMEQLKQSMLKCLAVQVQQ